MSLNTATLHSGIGKDRLKRLAKDPNCCIIGFRDPDLKTDKWVFDRDSLDEYRYGQYNAMNLRHAELEKKALQLAG